MKRVLIIEDNAAIRENTAELLELNRFIVLTAENGQSGFELAKTSVPDIILCDMMMPDTDGRQFLKLVKEDNITANIPLIFFSAGSLSPEIQEQLVTGKDGYLKKPFTEEDLLNAVRKAGIISNLNSKVIL
jgi:CheY-like chemotaxis protein